MGMLTVCLALTMQTQVGKLDASGSDLLRLATMKGIERACSFLPRPGDNVSAPIVDKDLLEKVIGAIECFAADGAPDEQLAGRELASGLALAGGSVSDLDGVLKKSLPNLKASCRPHIAKSPFGPFPASRAASARVKSKKIPPTALALGGSR